MLGVVFENLGEIRCCAEGRVRACVPEFMNNSVMGSVFTQ